MELTAWSHGDLHINKQFWEQARSLYTQE